MKKISMILFSLFLGLFFITNVYAEDLPREGVHYFITYPNQEEVVTSDYEEAIDPPEKLVYSGTTDSNGEIVLKDWNESEVRIVQRNSLGNEKSVQVVQGGSTSFVIKDLVNPKTYTYYLFIVFLLIVVVAFVLVFKKGRIKIAVFLIPLMIIGFSIFKVYASNGDFIIIAEDSNGNRVPGVLLDIYAKPSKVEASAAVKILANGGHFFDGSTEFYVKLPYDGCTFRDGISQLTEEERQRLFINIELSYREYYTPQLPNISSNNEYHNGDEILINWEYDENATLVTIDTNGGVFNAFGFNMTEIVTYPIYLSELFEAGYTHPDFTAFGYDDNPSCSHYDNPMGWDYTESTSDKMYVCWKKIQTLEIDDETIQFEEGMTWEEWIASVYNTIDLQYDSTLEILYSEADVVICSSGTIYNYHVLLDGDNIVGIHDLMNSNVSYQIRQKYWSNLNGSLGEMHDGFMMC